MMAEKTLDKNEVVSPSPKEVISRVYEIGFHIVPSVSQEDVPREFGNVKAVIEKHGGIFISEEMPKLRSLAYPMFKIVGTKKEKCNEAYFGWVKFDATSDAIDKIKLEVEKLDTILRVLTIETVRESTFVQPRLASKRPESDKKPESSEEVTTEEVSTEAIDESIDKLVIE